MIGPGLPAIGVGREIGAANTDDEGIARAKNAGRNMAWLLKAVTRSRSTTLSKTKSTVCRVKAGAANTS